MSYKITVITVVYNAGRFFEWTLKSVRDQKFDGIEYIVIDGGSTDNTLELLENYRSIVTKWISEPDEGLYSAMNKGLRMASGEYVMFLNAGDIFYDDNVLKRIFSDSSDGSDIFFGETMIIDKNGDNVGMRRLKAPPELSWKSLIDGMLVCHQSFIVRKSLAPEYDLKFRIASDYDWMLKCLKNAKNITNTHLVISKFLDGGMNKHNIRKALSERFLIMIRNYNFFLVLLNHFLIGFRFIVSYARHGRF